MINLLEFKLLDTHTFGPEILRIDPELELFRGKSSQNHHDLKRIGHGHVDFGLISMDEVIEKVPDSSHPRILLKHISYSHEDGLKSEIELLHFSIHLILTFLQKGGVGVHHEFKHVQDLFLVHSPQSQAMRSLFCMRASYFYPKQKKGLLFLKQTNCILLVSRNGLISFFRVKFFPFFFRSKWKRLITSVQVWEHLVPRMKRQFLMPSLSWDSRDCRKLLPFRVLAFLERKSSIADFLIRV